MAIRRSVVDKDLGLGSIINNVTSLNNRVVKVGLFSEDKSSDGEYNMATLGKLQIEGDNNKIPSRDFMNKTAIDFEDEIAKQMVLDGGFVTVGLMTSDKALNNVGKKYTELTRVTITNFETPKNSDATISRKGSNDPLVETGSMRDSVKFKIVGKR